MSDLTLDSIKVRWNEVLDAVLDADRIAWLAFFDARLAGYESGTLTLDFSDPLKLGGDHNFSLARNPKHIALLQAKFAEVFGIAVEVKEA
jgi:hypothetical protein